MPARPPVVDAQVAALRSSVARLRGVVSRLDDADLTRRSYATEWTIADVLSHLGSGAVITQRRLEDVLAGAPTPDDFAPGVWDEWNAKTPGAQRDDALAADAALLARVEAVTSEEAGALTFAMGPMTLDFAGFVGMRLNEHALHVWDIEVVGDPAATLPRQAAEVVVDNLDLIARFTGRPTGDTTTITVATSDPRRVFAVALESDAVTFGPGSDAGSADVELPAEAFVRLVYGRLDSEHTPPGEDSAALHVLRRVFPGPLPARSAGSGRRPVSGVPTLQRVGHRGCGGHEGAGEALVDPHPTHARDVLRELCLQAGGPGEDEGGAHRRPEQGRQGGAYGDLAAVGPVPEQVQRRAAQAGAQGDGHRVVEARVRRPVRVEQVRAVPVRRKPADGGGEREGTQGLAADGHGGPLVRVNSGGVHAAVRGSCSDCRGASTAGRGGQLLRSWTGPEAGRSSTGKCVADQASPISAALTTASSTQWLAVDTTTTAVTAG
jgi:uncharacterized protein (TIGR03083 family)